MNCHSEKFIILTLFLMLFCDSTSSECTQVSPCICRLPNGNYYNLTAFADKETFIDQNTNWAVHFHPCKNIPISINNKTCANSSGTSLCILNKNTNTTQNLGTIQDTQMKLDNDKKFPIFEIHYTNVTSVIDIMCNTNSITHFVIDKIIPDKRYHFILLSPYGCMKEPHTGLSTGSILLIISFTFCALYFSGGIIVLKTLRGARGWEMLPNHEFWCELPSLVRDGIVFTFNCCRADSYERI